jgi:acetyl-CoA synthetase
MSLDPQDSGHGSGVDFLRPLPLKLADYRKQYKESLANRAAYWSAQAKRLDWSKAFVNVVEEDFTIPRVAWFAGGRLNAAVNALLRNQDAAKADKPALAFFGNTDEPTVLTYAQLLANVQSAVKSLVALGASRQNPVALYLPNRPEVIILSLACAWLGIPYGPIAKRFPVERALHCINELDARVVLVSANGAESPYDNRLNELSQNLENVTLINAGQDTLAGSTPWSNFLKKGDAVELPEPVDIDAEDTLMVLYGKSVGGSPMGGLYAIGGYLVQAATSFSYIFADGRPEKGNRRIYNAVDLASSAGQTYAFWGPLLSGGAVYLADTNQKPGVKEVCAALKETPISMLCKPTMIARVKEELNGQPLPCQSRFNRVVSLDDSLPPRLVAFAATNLTQDATRVQNCWIQNESGAALMSDFTGPELNRAGSLGLPAFGVEPQVLSDFGDPCGTNISGQLAFKQSWPGMIRSVYKSENRLREFHFNRFPSCFSTNDGMRIDADGFFWFMGRLDDMIKMHGHSLATSEVEAVLITHEAVNESAVVGIAMETHDELVTFIVPNNLSLMNDPTDTNVLSAELADFVARKLGDFARPSRVVYVSELPRTSTGKVVRRLLRRIASGDVRNGEDLSHVANPESLTKLMKQGGE